MTTIAKHHQIETQGLKTHFVTIGDGKKPLVFLHGWGGSTQSFFTLAHKLVQTHTDYQCIIVDYPGFGLTEFPKNQSWDTYQYAEWVYDFMTTINIPKADFYVHSFGGRILVRLFEKHPQVIEKMIFTGAAGVKWPLSVRQKISVFLSKIMPKFKHGLLGKLQKIVVTKIFGARDWGNVDPNLKGTLKNVLAEPDLREKLLEIKNSSLVIWGAKDSITPLKSGNVYARNLENSVLKVFPNGKHGIHHTHQKEILEALNEFL